MLDADRQTHEAPRYGWMLRSVKKEREIYFGRVIENRVRDSCNV